MTSPGQFLYATMSLDAWRGASGDGAASSDVDEDGRSHNEWRAFAMSDPALEAVAAAKEEAAAAAASDPSDPVAAAAAAATKGGNLLSLSGGGASVPMVWLAHAGVTAQCHYDRSHNWSVGARRPSSSPPPAAAHVCRVAPLRSTRQS